MNCTEQLELIKNELGKPSREEAKDDGQTLKSELSLLRLPPELSNNVFSFMDVPMLGKMAQVHSGLLRETANDDLVWGSLAKQRFHISTNTQRPKSFGGKNWKDSYRSMHSCNRVPKSRWTNRKTVFAKGDAKAGTNSLSVWVTLHHTENCRTRVLRTYNMVNGNTSITTRRYVEFWVCLQNTKSNGPPIRVDVSKAQLQFLGGLGAVYTEEPIQEEYRYGYRWVAPRLLHKHTQNKNHHNEDDIRQGIWLNPLEFCVVSVPFEVGQDDFETDVLARTVSMIFPFATENVMFEKMQLVGAASGIYLKEAPPPMNVNEAQAWFVPESDVWDNYCELPGGCMTLSNRDRRLHV